MSDEAIVYFPDSAQPSPNKRVRRFRLPTEYLYATSERVVGLENLPPWRDGCFVTLGDDLTLEGARSTFLQHFPNGLNDQRFLTHEVAYKRAAHTRWIDSKDIVRNAVDSEDPESIAVILDLVYGKRGSDGDSVERLNLMYQRVEEPFFFDALRAGGPVTVRFAKAALEFIDAPSATTFDQYTHALAGLTTRDGKPLNGWVTLTWLPFIANPASSFLIKPTIVQRFAASLPYDVRYHSDPNFETYRRSAEMALTIRDWLSTSDLNASGRPLDLIDVQSFMWVVERYLPGD